MTKSNRTKLIAQFNKVSGAFICFLEMVDIKDLNTTYFTYEEVEADIDNDIVVGRHPHYKIYNIDERPEQVFERKLNLTCRDKIKREYSVETQCDRMRVVLESLASTVSEQLNVDINGLEALIEMNEFIDDVKQANKVLKESYKNHVDFEYISIEQENEEYEAKLEGGLHELVYGPRKINI